MHSAGHFALAVSYVCLPLVNLPGKHYTYIFTVLRHQLSSTITTSTPVSKFLSVLCHFSIINQTTTAFGNQTFVPTYFLKWIFIACYLSLKSQSNTQWSFVTFNPTGVKGNLYYNIDKHNLVTLCIAIGCFENATSFRFRQSWILRVEVGVHLTTKTDCENKSD